MIRVVDDSGALPDADEPRQRREVGGKIGREVEHARPSALAAVQVLQHDDGDERDRERGEREEAHEEEFERDEIHGNESSPGSR